MTRDELRTAFPIDGREVSARARTWTVNVVDIADAGGDSFRVGVEFEGDGPRRYTATLHLNKDRLRKTPEQNAREVELILADIATWLETDPPAGVREFI